MSSLRDILLLILPPLATAFGTINEPILLGQHNEHEMITRLAFQCGSGQKSDGICFEPRSLDQLAGYHRHVMGVAIPGAGFNGAVGSPDTFDPVPEGPEAHCDDADFLDTPGYPQTREEATAKLQECIDHMRTRFHQGLESAGRLLDERRRIRQPMVELFNPFIGDCTFAFPALQEPTFGRAKCSTLEGFGRALHGVQDFYSHSNWADIADPMKPISVSNPPGLAMNGTAPFLNLATNGPIPPYQIPRNLTTGCFTVPDLSPGFGDCEGRITHQALSKDCGVIHLDGTFGEVGPGSPRSEVVESNFYRSVEAALEHSRDTWDSFREEMRLKYGVVSGNLMICALVRDDPVKNCRNRTLAIAVDKSYGSGVDGIAMESAFAQELNSRLTMHGLDKVAIVEYDETARLVQSMGYPIHAAFGFSKPGGKLSLGSGLELALAENIEAQPETYTDRGAVLLLATGSESHEASESTLKQLARAMKEGIRVHYACITIPESPGGPDPDTGRTKCSPAHHLLPPVLKTGGVVVLMDTPNPKTPGYFANLIMDRGLTATDDKDTPEHTRIYPGITLADFLSTEYPNKSFRYPVSSGENLNFTITSVPLEGHGAENCYTISLWNKDLDTKMATHTRCGGSDPLSLPYEASDPVELVLMAEYGDAAVTNELIRREEIIFTIAVTTTIPEKDETTVKSETSILSSVETDALDEATLCLLTSETLEFLASTVTVDGRTSTTTETSQGYP
ncbi:hypothetical protein N0V88_007579 [Collariella sp. IMI 366227]|nr:hypothetical protein N0V88_007579 [Collariella sp. IMI 366227]